MYLYLIKSSGKHDRDRALACDFSFSGLFSLSFEGNPTEILITQVTLIKSREQ